MPQLNVQNVSNFNSLDDFSYQGVKKNSEGNIQGKVYVRWDILDNQFHFHQFSKIGLFFHKLGLWKREYNKKDLQLFFSGYKIGHLSHSNIDTSQPFRTRASVIFKEIINAKKHPSSPQQPNQTPSQQPSTPTPPPTSGPPPPQKTIIEQWEEKKEYWFDGGFIETTPYVLSVQNFPKEMQESLPKANYFFVVASAAEVDVDEVCTALKPWLQKRQQDEKYQDLPVIIVISRLGEHANKILFKINKIGCPLFHVYHIGSRPNRYRFPQEKIQEMLDDIAEVNRQIEANPTSYTPEKVLKHLNPS